VVATLEPGEPVLVLDRGQAEHWLLVRDSIGQVGYVLDSSVGDSPPRRTPGEPFTRCLRLRTERDAVSCLDRAEEQKNACVRHCETATSPTDCESGCTARRAECISSCRSPDETQPAPPASDPPGATTSSDDAAPADNEQPAVAPATPPKKKTTDTSRKKRRKSRK
jgi:hypothetical protein